ncbi:MAG: PKD domain-containing protein [Verrucomicrobiales bacterium]|nr:PKD domain-containing protein [Verrucomicrobiales bacterium]
MAQSRPSNDDFPGFRLAGGNVTVGGDNSGATKQAGEPNHAGFPGGKSVWWHWSPPTNGLAVVTTEQVTFDTLLGVYIGKTVAETRDFPVASNNDLAPGTDAASRVEFDADLNAVYNMAVDGIGGSSGAFELHIQLYTIPVVLRHPESIEVREGGRAGFVVTAIGARNTSVTPVQGLQYQWQFQAEGASAMKNLVGATNSTLEIPAATQVHHGLYRCVVSNLYGQVASEEASLKTVEPPVIVEPPIGGRPTSCQSYCFFVTALGAVPMTYTWEFQPLGRDDWLFVDQTVSMLRSNSLCLSNLYTTQSGNYRVTISNRAGSVTNDPPATLQVVPSPPVVTLQPTNNLGFVGESIRLSFAATGCEPLAYQWQFRASNAPAIPRQALDGETGTTFQIAALDPSYEGYYSAEISNRDGTVTTREVLLSVRSRPPNDDFAMAIPLDSLCGTNFGSNLYATTESREPAHAGKSPLNSVWWSFQPNSNGVVSISLGDTTMNPRLGVYTGDSLPSLKEVTRGARSALFYASADTTYWIAVDGVDGSQGTFQLRLCLDTIGDCPQWAPGEQPQGFQEIGDIDGGLGCRTRILSGLAISLSPIRYQWFRNGLPVSGATNRQLILSSITAAHAGDYQLAACTDCGCTNSQIARVSVVTVPRITQQPSAPSQPLDLCSQLSLQVAAESCPALTYQWRFAGQPILSATNPVHFIPSVNPLTAGAYDAVVANKNGAVTSEVARVRLNPSPFIVRNPASTANNLCDQVTFKLGTNVCDDAIFQWRHNGLPIAGQTSTTLILPSLTPAHVGDYDVVASFGGGAVTSQVASVRIEAPPVVRSPDKSTYALCESVTLQVAAPACPDVRFQWRFGGAPLPNQTNRVLSLPNLTPKDQGVYDVLIEVDGTFIASKPASIAEQINPSFSSEPVPDQTVRNCDDVRLCASLVPTPCVHPTFQWFRGPLGGQATIPIPGATDSCLLLTNLTPSQSGVYQLEVKNGLGTARSRLSVLHVDGLPLVRSSTDPASLRVRAGDSFTNHVTAVNCEPLTYRWTRNGTAVVTDARHQTTAEGWLVVTGASPEDAGEYRCQVSNKYGTNATSAGSVRVVRPPPNDQFANRIPLRGTNVVAQRYSGTPYDNGEPFDNELATLESGELPAGGKPGGRSVWWSWSHSQPSEVTIDLQGSKTLTGTAALDTRISVYKGNRLDGLELVAQDDQGNRDGTSRVTFLAARDREFQIQVDAANGQEGTLEIRINATEIISPPIILEQPQSLAALAGATVMFNVRAFGSPDIAYRWFRDAVEIPGQNSTNLVLRNIQAADEANYRVVLANELGSVTSHIARLTFGTLIKGQVTDATNTNAVPRAKISVGGRVTETDENGNYELTDVYPGNLTPQFSANRTLLGLLEDPGLTNESTFTAVTLRAEKRPEFIDYEDFTFEPAPGQTVTNNIAMSPSLTGIRFILSWGLEPADLDAHLLVSSAVTNYQVDYHWLPVLSTNGSSWTYPFNPPPDKEPYLSFDRDARRSYGPETITLQRVINGTYRMVVQKYEPTSRGSLALSGATVKVYRTNELLRASELVGTRHVPTNGTGDFWWVCDVDGPTKSVTWVNQLLSSPPGLDIQTPAVHHSEPSQGRSGLLLASPSNRATTSGPRVTALWDFGDTHSSTAWQPNHTYEAPGCYQVKLTLTQLKDENATVKTKVRECYIEVTNGPPVVSIRQPVNHRIHRSIDSIQVQVDAYDSDPVPTARGISKVELFQVDNGKTNPVVTLSPESSRPVNLAETNRYTGFLPAPGKEAPVVLVARATDRWGSNTWSAPVEVNFRDLDGDVLIIRNFSDPEITQMKDWLDEIKVPQRVNNDGQLKVRILDQEGLYFELVRDFKLIIWNDLGSTTQWITDNDVEVLAQAKASGIPVYLMGDTFASSISHLPLQSTQWQRLTHVKLGPVSKGPGWVEPLNTRPEHEFFDGRYGHVDPFSYQRGADENWELVDDQAEVVANTDGKPSMLRDPIFSKPDFGQARSVIHNFRVANGSQPESVEERRKLYLNAVAWLLRLWDCQSFGGHTANPVVDPGFVVGIPTTWQVEVTQNGECTLGGMIVTNLLSPLLELISFEVMPISRNADTNTVRSELLSNGIVHRFSYLPRGSHFAISITARPKRPGDIANTNSLSFGILSRPDLVEHWTATGTPCQGPVQLSISRTSNGGRLIHIDWPPGCSIVVEVSDDLLTWSPWFEPPSALTGTAEVALDRNSQPYQFYRARIQ